MSFETDFEDMLETNALSAQPGTRDETGAFIPSGSPTVVNCYIEMENVLVTDAGGKQIVSTVQVFVGVNDFTIDGFLYTLPSRYPQSNDLEAIAIDRVNDDVGPYYEMISI